MADKTIVRLLPRLFVSLTVCALVVAFGLYETGTTHFVYPLLETLTNQIVWMVGLSIGMFVFFRIEQ